MEREEIQQSRAAQIYNMLPEGIPTRGRTVSQRSWPGRTPGRQTRNLSHYIPQVQEIAAQNNQTVMNLTKGGNREAIFMLVPNDEVAEVTDVIKKREAEKRAFREKNRVRLRAILPKPATKQEILLQKLKSADKNCAPSIYTLASQLFPEVFTQLQSNAIRNTNALLGELRKKNPGQIQKRTEEGHKGMHYWFEDKTKKTKKPTERDFIMQSVLAVKTRLEALEKSSV